MSYTQGHVKIDGQLKRIKQAFTKVGERFYNILSIGEKQDAQWKNVLYLSYPVPPGTIAVWSGTAETIPGGWALCDGTNGTPNLVGKFIKGGTNIGATTSGSAHAHTMGSAGAHTHTVSTGTHRHTYTNDGTKQFRYSAGGVYTNWGGGHTHSMSTATEHTHSVVEAITEPLHYVLAYIMKE